jgi:hypothetical protein
VFWEMMVLRTNAPFFFRLLGIPFVLAGCCLSFGRFVADAGARARIRHALANRRILIIRAGITRSVTALSLDRLPEIQLSQRADGPGTRHFGLLVPAGVSGGGVGWRYRTPALDPACSS